MSELSEPIKVAEYLEKPLPIGIVNLQTHKIEARFAGRAMARVCLEAYAQANPSVRNVLTSHWVGIQGQTEKTHSKLEEILNRCLADLEYLDSVIISNPNYSTTERMVSIGLRTAVEAIAKQLRS
jgi:hypothetical protein